MVEKFHTELEMMKEHTLEMGSLSQTMLQRGTQALTNQDLKLADWVMKRKERLAGWDESIEEEALRLMALYQPMAQDLRAIACTLKIITYLTRIGIYGKDIAVVAEKSVGMSPVRDFFHIPRMANIVCSMVDEGLTAYAHDSISPIENMGKRDDEVDALFLSTLNGCITAMTDDPKKIPICTNYVLIARYLERSGDHACKIAEKVHFMVTGERVEIT
ncbi:MAG: phosphate signaling complex protein PhoU [Methanomicrobiales archaeon]|nr:phosphate signaling complex protein PhoU [Methanomicrobiales archaeon]MDD1654860.1 phosphate signaling complex protein PhoU [Methanomicrobiales archaeon]